MSLISNIPSWFHRMRGEENRIEPGKTHLIQVRSDSGESTPVPYLVGEPSGTETLKLFASDQPFDFRVIQTPPGIRGRSLNGVLEKLFDGMWRGVRSNPVISRNLVNTDTVVFQVEP